MGHLNGILARVGGNLNKKFQKSQMPGGLPGGGMLKLRFDRYITGMSHNLSVTQLLYVTRGPGEFFMECLPIFKNPFEQKDFLETFSVRQSSG